jgi:hypothetical protein
MIEIPQDENGARFLTSFKRTPSALRWIATTIQPALIADDARQDQVLLSGVSRVSAGQFYTDSAIPSAHTRKDRDVERPKQGECYEENCSHPYVSFHSSPCRHLQVPRSLLTSQWSSRRAPISSRRRWGRGRRARPASASGPGLAPVSPGPR